MTTGMRQCPYCAEEIRVEAIKCRFCKESVPPGNTAPGKAADAAEQKQGSNKVAVGCLSIFIVFLFLYFVGTITSRTSSSSGNRTTATTPAPKTTPTPNRRAVYAKREDNIRAGAGTNFDVVRRTRTGERLEYRRKDGEWYQLAASGDQEQWVHESVVWTEAENNAALELGDWSWSTTAGGSYVEATGQVRNLTNQPLENVQATVSFFTSDGTFITSSDALIEYNPLMPGQTSPWRVLEQHNPQMQRARVEFKELFGGTISFRVR